MAGEILSGMILILADGLPSKLIALVDHLGRRRPKSQAPSAENTQPPSLGAPSSSHMLPSPHKHYDYEVEEVDESVETSR